MPYTLHVTPPARTEFRGGTLITEKFVYSCLKIIKARHREARVVNRCCCIDKNISRRAFGNYLPRNEAYTIGTTFQTGPGAHPASCKIGTGSFPGVKCGRGVLLTTHLLLVSWSLKSRAIPLPTLWATPGL